MMIVQRFLIQLMMYIGAHALRLPTQASSRTKGRLWRDVGTSCGPGADAEQTNPVVASMTTVPYRIENIQMNIIHNMNIEGIDRLYLSVPFTYASGTELTHLPVWLESLMRDNMTKICVVRTKDWGPATKLFGTLHAKDVPDAAKIITLDDDRHYEPLLIRKLLEASRVHPNFVITNAAWPIQNALSDGVSSIQGQHGYEYHMEGETDLVLGCGGVLYPNKLIFDDKTFDMESEAGISCLKTDDIWISGHLERLGIRRWVIVDHDPAYNVHQNGAINGGDFRGCMSKMRNEFGIFR